MNNRPELRHFELHYHAGAGMHGTGVELVADGVMWPDWSCTIKWRGTVNWHQIEHAFHVHGPTDATQFIWLDSDGNQQNA